MVERFVSIEEAAGSMPAFSTFTIFWVSVPRYVCLLITEAYCNITLDMLNTLGVWK